MTFDEYLDHFYSESDKLNYEDYLAYDNDYLIDLDTEFINWECC